MRRVALIVSLVLLSAAVFSACGGDKESPPSSSSPAGPQSAAEAPSTTASSAPSAQAAGAQIVISNMSYVVPPTVKPGEELTIVNNDQGSHTVTADQNNMFDVRVSGSGGVMQFTAPNAPGTYPFHCKYHDNMHGVLTVQ